MIKREKKEVIRFEEVQTAVICDCCKKEIEPKCGYFHVTTYHNDWGNDSVDSYEYMDFCCPDCLLTFAKPYIQDSYSSRFNTMGMEIEHKKGYIA